MEFELLSGSHAVGEANYHMQFTPAYRAEIFADELVKVLARDYILEAARRHKITITAIGFGTDHCHVFATNCKNFSPSKIANILKGFSSRMMRKNHWNLFKKDLYGKKFWSGGYFYRTVGAVGLQHITKPKLEKILIPIPSLPEQRRIVAYFDKLQEKVDALKNLQQETEKGLEALLPSVLNQAFNGGIEN